MKLKGKYAEIIKIAGPAMVESCFTAVVGMIDSLMVSSLGTYAVAAVGLCNQPKLMAFSFFFAVNSSVSVLVARRKGENELLSVHQIILTAFILGGIAGIIIGGICFAGADHIIRLCGSSPEMHRDAVIYFRIIMTGILFQVFSLLINAALRGIGATSLVMKINIISQCMNLLGNYLLIEGNWGFPAKGVGGAAFATVFSYAVSLALSLLCIAGQMFDIRLDMLLQAVRTRFFLALKGLLKLGLPSLAEQILMRIGFLAAAVMAAGFGTSAFAVNHAGMNVFTLTYAFGEGMQVAAVTLIGQSLGEKNIAKAQIYLKTLLCAGIVFALGLSILYVAGAEFYMRLYFREAAILSVGKRMMYICAVIVHIQMAQQIVTGGLKGAGDVLFITCSTVVSVTIIRPVLTYLFCYVAEMGVLGFWLGMLLDQNCRLLFVWRRYRRDKWAEIII